MLALLLLLLSVAGAVGRDAQAAFPGNVGMIVFSSQRGFDDLNLWVANADGTGLRKITGRETNDGAPAWSPDGRRIAYGGSLRGLPGRHVEIFVIGVGGGQRRRPTRGVFASDPAWSPDAARIVFITVERRPYRDSLVVMLVNGTGKRQLTSRLSCERAPAWSPDGRKILFQAGCRASAIYVVGSEGTSLRRLVANAVDPSWSPDGEKIAFRRGRSIVVANADGSGQTQIATSERFPTSGPAWSPDGSALVFSEESVDDCGTRSTEKRLMVVNVDGSGLRPLLSSVCSGDDLSPDWQPRCTIYGTDRRDVIAGTAGDDVICALRGNDVIRGGTGNDVILAGDGNDVVYGGRGSDRLFGAAGSDRIYARDQTEDVVNGGPGDDRGWTDLGLERTAEVESVSRA